MFLIIVTDLNVSIGTGSVFRSDAVVDSFLKFLKRKYLCFFFKLSFPLLPVFHGDKINCCCLVIRDFEKWRAIRASVGGVGQILTCHTC